MMSPVDAKILSMCLLGLVSIGLGMLPMAIISKLNWDSTGEGTTLIMQSLLSALLCFGGGVLMGVGFLHMLPDILHEFERLQKSQQLAGQTDLPLGVVVICAGFFAVYLIEELVHLIADRCARNRAEVSLHRTVSIRSCLVGRDGPNSPGPRTPDAVDCQPDSICQRECDAKEFCSQVSSDEKDRSTLLTPNPTVKVVMGHRYGTFPFAAEENPLDPTLVRLKGTENVASQGSAADLQERPQTEEIRRRGVSIGNHHHHLSIANDDRHVGASLSGLMVIMALSFHEILEGLAVGLQRDTSDILQLFGAIAAHKYVISFCVGMQLATSGITPLIQTFYIAVLSLVTPLGIGIGIWIMSVSDGDVGDSLVSAVFQGLACGTILYVTFFEILERERSKSTAGLLQWSLLVLGFLCILGLQSIGEPRYDRNSIDVNTVDPVAYHDR